MLKKILLTGLIAGVVASVAATTTAAPIAQPSAPPAPIAIACPSYVLPSPSTFQTDWTVESPQGWLDRASVSGGGIYCDYGIDRAKPAERPAFRVRRPAPPNTICTVDANRTSVTCTTSVIGGARILR